MIFPAAYLIKAANNGETKLKDFLVQMYPRWQLWYNWFYDSQENPTMPFTFSWRGRTPDGVLPSGLDDYPRAFLVHEFKEIHLDLQTWMVQFSEFMSSYASLANDQPNVNLYLDHNAKINAELQNRLFDPAQGIFADYLGKQWTPIISGTGVLSEPLEWRDDMKCGKKFESTLKLPAKCT